MTVYDDKGTAHPDVGTGAKDCWARRDNRYPGCTCPPWRYSPRTPRPTDAHCPSHGSERT